MNPVVILLPAFLISLVALAVFIRSIPVAQRFATNRYAADLMHVGSAETSV